MGSDLSSTGQIVLYNSLPNELQRKLNFPRVRHGGMEAASAISARNVQGVPRLIEQKVRVHGSLKVGAIEDIEELSTELDIEFF